MNGDEAPGDTDSGLNTQTDARDAARPEAISPGDSVWRELQAQAAGDRSAEQLLSYLYADVIEARSFEEALVRVLAAKLGHAALPADVLNGVLLETALSDASFGEAARSDLIAAVRRDPAANRVLDPFLFSKGFAAIETYRLSHRLWTAGRQDLALYLQSRSSEIFQADIHPGARIGKGIFLDHATGFVAGETVLIEDNVSILQGVTLGGTGTEKVDRHPKIRTGVLLGASAHLIGPIEIGAYSKIAPCSFVAESVPPGCTAIGVPAHIIEGAGSSNPAETMNQQLEQETFGHFHYTI
ncbi:MAG: serine O-acetyltransferase [Rhodomicrobium sp.]